MFKHLFEFNEPYAYIDGSTGGARGAVAPPYFWTKGPKKIFGETAPQSPLSKGLDDSPIPPPPLISRYGSSTGLLNSCDVVIER